MDSTESELQRQEFGLVLSKFNIIHIMKIKSVEVLNCGGRGREDLQEPRRWRKKSWSRITKSKVLVLLFDNKTNGFTWLDTNSIRLIDFVYLFFRISYFCRAFEKSASDFSGIASRFSQQNTSKALQSTIYSTASAMKPNNYVWPKHRSLGDYDLKCLSDFLSKEAQIIQVNLIKSLK